MKPSLASITSALASVVVGLPVYAQPYPYPQLPWFRPDVYPQPQQLQIYQTPSGPDPQLEYYYTPLGRQPKYFYYTDGSRAPVSPICGKRVMTDLITFVFCGNPPEVAAVNFSNQMASWFREGLTLEIGSFRRNGRFYIITTANRQRIVYDPT